MTIVMTMEPIRALVDSIDLWDPRRHADPDHEFDYIDISSVNREAKCVNGLSRTCVTDAPSRARQRVQAGDVLVSTVRPNLNAVAVVPDGLQDGTASTGFCVLRPRAKRLDARYLFYWVRTPQFIDTMTRLATGASYPAVTDRTILDSQIPLPPSFEEQRRIADILDEADSLRRKRVEAIRLANELPFALYHELLASPLAKAWPVEPLDEAVELINGRAFKSSDWGDQGLPIIRIQNLKEPTAPYNYYAGDYEERHRVADGDVLLSWSGQLVSFGVFIWDRGPGVLNQPFQGDRCIC